MKKSFTLNELECANCAAKMEDAIRRLDGVTDVSVNFMAQKMVLETPDDRFDAILSQVREVVRKIEPDVTLS